MHNNSNAGQSRAAQVNNSVACNEHYHMLAASKRCRTVMLHSCAKFASTKCTQNSMCSLVWCMHLGGQSFVAGKQQTWLQQKPQIGSQPETHC
jgi:hypothetical protein